MNNQSSTVFMCWIVSIVPGSLVSKLLAICPSTTATARRQILVHLTERVLAPSRRYWLQRCGMPHDLPSKAHAQAYVLKTWWDTL